MMLSIFLGTIVVFNSCEGDDIDDDLRASVTMYSSGGNFTVNTLDTWRAATSTTWITILNSTGEKGDSIRVVISPNKTGAERKGIISVEGVNKKVKNNIVVIQQPIMSGQENGHEYVDLGTSVFWSKEQVQTSDKRMGFAEDEALSIAKEWGGRWRLPTIAEYKEMLDFCDMSGEIIKAPNGEFINWYLVVDIIIDQTVGINPGGGVNGGSAVYGGLGNHWCWTDNSYSTLSAYNVPYNEIYVPDYKNPKLGMYLVLDR